MPTNPWVTARSFINCGLYLTYFVYLIWRTVVISQEPTATLALKVHIGFSTLFYLPGAILYVTVLRTRTELVPFLTRFITFLKNGERLSQTPKNQANYSHFFGHLKF